MVSGDLSTPETENMVMLANASVDRVVRASKRIARATVVGHTVLFEINGVTDPTKKRRIFKSRMEKHTLVRYIRVVQRILAYIIRTTEDWEPAKRPGYTLTREQEGAYDDFTFELSEQMNNPDREQQSYEKADRLLLTLIVSLFDHQLKDNVYESAVLSGLAVLGVQGSYDESQGKSTLNWLMPYEYTPFYAAVIKIIRLLVIYNAYLLNQQTAKKIRVERKMSQEDAEREAPANTNELDLGHVCLWYGHPYDNHDPGQDTVGRRGGHL
ncbi:putative dna protein [Phaeoacremonium minimum UCRPA7]|uniref:Putative dna protein n=1 Tax=Phaeoacremonium minimum (strain UCR-PA7) TaxID=1286976 RepID=R8BA46_PHAM7|nr:putative dna protein [Phaeoacremonium minimum UCRPA7]EON96194.1 putative dna protein [Phaeoacremonium minimum UCRPA7]